MIASEKKNTKRKKSESAAMMAVNEGNISELIFWRRVSGAFQDFSEPYLKFANPGGQKIRKVEDTERDLIEIVKYGTKIFTDPTMQKKSKDKAPAKKITPYVYVSAMDNIITAMSGHRVFDRFGFDLPKPDRTPGGKRTKLTDYTELKYDSHLCDWIDSETEKALSGFVPSRMLRAIMENNIDKDLE